MGKKDSPTTPAPPDPAATAAAQTQANIGSATAQANLNRIDQYTPQGSLQYFQRGTNPDGTPMYTQLQTYSPDEQKKYDQNNQVAIALNNTALSNIGRVQDVQGKELNFGNYAPNLSEARTAQGITGAIAPGGNIQKSLDYSGATKLPGTDDFSADAAKVRDSVYAQAASRLDPKYQQSDSDLKSSLAAQGISENSDAYRRATDNAARAKTDAYNQANYSAIQAGSDEQSRLFGLSLAARQQGVGETNTQGDYANAAQGQQYAQNAQAGAFANTAQNQEFNQQAQNVNFSREARQQTINEATYLRNLPLNDIAALLGTGAGVQGPDFQPVSQVGVAAPDYQGIVQNNYQNAVAQANAAKSAQAQMYGSIFGAAGTVGAAALSDRRFKENIKRIGTLANGIATYAFNYIGNAEQEFGVMAQEVLQVIPEAVVHKDGVMYVDYGKVY